MILKLIPVAAGIGCS